MDKSTAGDTFNKQGSMKTNRAAGQIQTDEGQIENPMELIDKKL